MKNYYQELIKKMKNKIYNPIENKKLFSENFNSMLANKIELIIKQKQKQKRKIERKHIKSKEIIM